MANSRYAYVRSYETPDPLLPGTFLVVRIDGHGFHQFTFVYVAIRFSDRHNFVKPNDLPALELMNRAAQDVVEAYPDVVLAFGESDEYSFLLRKSCKMFNRRHSKILTTLTSHFTSSYVFHWTKFFPSTPLAYPPTFDGRVVIYPSEVEVRDYFSWRQVDTHINNLYNTTFWALVQQGGLTTTEAHARLKGTFSKDKNEILFSEFGINYNHLPEIFRKGSIVLRMHDNGPAEERQEEGPGEASFKVEAEEGLSLSHPREETQAAKDGSDAANKQSEKLDRSKSKKSKKSKVVSERDASPSIVLHCDLVKSAFWGERKTLLG